MLRLSAGKPESEVRTVVRVGALRMSLSNGAAASEAQMVSWCHEARQGPASSDFSKDRSLQEAFQCLNVGSESFFGKHTVSTKNRCKNKEKKGKNWKLETMSHQPGFHGGGGSKEGGAAGGELRLLPGRPPGAPGWAPTALVMLQYRQP